ncbi:MAG: hypothetical protein RML56_11435 [Burkholderiales bacterium]|nr:hypothetical protein [Burkholderiales bacterium]
MEKRRGALRRAVAALAVFAPLAGFACDLAGAKRLEGRAFSLAYRTLPAPIRIGEHFALEIVVCPRPGVSLTQPPRADAWMPEHRHGMNYRPEMRALGAGRYRSEGWLFHMPGSWEFVFQAAGERLTDRVEVE